MPLSNPFKPKAPALPIADWIDHAAVQALQEEVQAARRIDAPVERLIALKTLDDKIKTTLETLPGYRITPPLTPAGNAALALLIARNTKKMTPLNATLLSLGCIIGLMTILSVAGPGALLPILCIGPLVGIAVETALRSYRSRPWRATLKLFHDTTKDLRRARTDLQDSIADIEANLSLSPVQSSSYLDTALALSPTLKARFAAEALRMTIESAAATPIPEPAATAAIIKPTRKTITP